MAPKNLNNNTGTMLVSIIGDEDTVTGMLLTGVGERNTQGETNYFVVDPCIFFVRNYKLETPQQEIEAALTKFLNNPSIAIVLVTQDIAEKSLRHLINQHDQIIPTILEIPSKESAYDPKRDALMQKANRLLYGADIV